MSFEWSTFGPDLLVALDPGDRRRSLEEALRDAVRAGRLPAETRLPSTRALAADLGVARGTVSEAYAQLVAEGFLVARRGSGTRVGDHAAKPVPRAPGPPLSPVPRYSLVAGRPDLASFPRGAWLAASRRALLGAPAVDLDYPDPRGLPVLREQLAAYLARVRAVEAGPERIVVCSGFGQALALLARVLAARGGTHLAMEAYGVLAHRDVIRSAGLVPDALAVDDAGAVVDALGEQAGVVLTAAHQFPLGMALSAERRERAVVWAREHHSLVVEDDYDGEFRYDRRPVGAVQGLDPERVAFVGTASKSLAPGVHLAWLVVPPSMLDEVVRAKQVADGFTGVLEQLTLAELIRSGGYDRHVRRSRLRYRRRRDELVTTLSARRPELRVTGLSAGLHAVVTLGGSLTAADEPAIVERAARAGLGLLGLDEHRMRSEPDAPAALVVGYATPPDHAYAGALDLLCDVLGGPRLG